MDFIYRVEEERLAVLAFEFCIPKGVKLGDILRSSLLEQIQSLEGVDEAILSGSTKKATIRIYVSRWASRDIKEMVAERASAIFASFQL